MHADKSNEQPLGTPWPPGLWLGEQGAGGEGRPRVRLFGCFLLPPHRLTPAPGCLVKVLAVGCGFNESSFLANLSTQ